VAAPLVDLPARPALCREGRPILDLYTGIWQSVRLHLGDYALCRREAQHQALRIPLAYASTAVAGVIAAVVLAGCQTTSTTKRFG